MYITEHFFTAECYVPGKCTDDLIEEFIEESLYNCMTACKEGGTCQSSSYSKDGQKCGLFKDCKDKNETTSDYITSRRICPLPGWNILF